MVEASWSADAALESLVATIDEGALVFDDAMRCRAAGRRVAQIIGLEPRTIVGLQRSEIVRRLVACSDTPDSILGAVGDGVLTSEGTVADPIEIARPQARILVWTSVPLVRGGVAAGRIDVIRDVTRERAAEREHEAMAKKLEEVSPIDPVTGLANRRRFEEECLREHRRAQRAWDSYAVARVDVDGMSLLNDAHGRAVGDEILRRLGEALRLARREYDVVARWVDDEFIMLLPGATGAATHTVIRRIARSAKANPIEVAGGLVVSVSVGASVWIPPSGEGPDDIIRRAGAALAAARAKGAGSFDVDAGVGEFKADVSDDLSEG